MLMKRWKHIKAPRLRRLPRILSWPDHHCGYLQVRTSCSLTSPEELLTVNGLLDGKGVIFGSEATCKFPILQSVSSHCAPESSVNETRCVSKDPKHGRGWLDKDNGFIRWGMGVRDCSVLLELQTVVSCLEGIAPEPQSPGKVTSAPNCWASL